MRKCKHIRMNMIIQNLNYWVNGLSLYIYIPLFTYFFKVEYLLICDCQNILPAYVSPVPINYTFPSIETFITYLSVVSSESWMPTLSYLTMTKKQNICDYLNIFLLTSESHPHLLHFPSNRSILHKSMYGITRDPTANSFLLNYRKEAKP